MKILRCKEKSCLFLSKLFTFKVHILFKLITLKFLLNTIKCIYLLICKRKTLSLRIQENVVPAYATISKGDNVAPMYSTLS